MDKTSNIVFETTDIFNKTIFLYGEDLKHIEDNHPELKGETEAIKKTINAPEVVYESKNIPNRSIFFKKGVHSKFSNLYTKTVVEYTDDKIGNVTTAFVCRDIQGVNGEGLQYVDINNKLW